jgi:hypothetical protein
LTQSRASLERELRAALQQVTRAAERAVSTAVLRRRDGDQAVHDELKRIGALRREALSLANEKPGGKAR